jgi:hypothetical protein
MELVSERRLFILSDSIDISTGQFNSQLKELVGEGEASERTIEYGCAC